MEMSNHKACIRYVFLHMVFQFLRINLHGLFFPFCSLQIFHYFMILSNIFTSNFFFLSLLNSVFRFVLITLLWNSSSTAISLLNYMACNTHCYPDVFPLCVLLRTLQYFSCYFSSVNLLDQCVPSLNFISRLVFAHSELWLLNNTKQSSVLGPWSIHVYGLKYGLKFLYLINPDFHLDFFVYLSRFGELFLLKHLVKLSQY